MMHIEALRDHCIAKKGVTEEFPFDESTLVFKVLGKMFLLCDVDNFQSINVKCDPEEAILLREQYPAVQPGYHMRKKHWNTVQIDGSISDKIIFEWIDNSYALVVSKMPRKLRSQLNDEA